MCNFRNQGCEEVLARKRRPQARWQRHESPLVRDDMRVTLSHAEDEEKEVKEAKEEKGGASEVGRVKSRVGGVCPDRALRLKGKSSWLSP